MCKDIKRLSSLNDQTTQGSHDQRHSKTKLSVTDDRQKLKKASPETLDNLEGKRVLNTFEERSRPLKGEGVVCLFSAYSISITSKF